MIHINVAFSSLMTFKNVIKLCHNVIMSLDRKCIFKILKYLEDAFSIYLDDIFDLCVAFSTLMTFSTLMLQFLL